MRYLLIISFFFSHFLPLAAKVEESIIPLMDVIFERNATANQPPKIRVIAYNMLYNVKIAEDKLPEIHRWASRKPRLLEYLEFTNADIIGSQELQANQLQEILESLGKTYAYYGEKTRENEGRTDVNAVFYKHERFKLVESKTTPYHDLKSQNAFTYCRLKDTASDKTFIVINTKFTYGISWGALKRREAEAIQLHDFIQDIPSDESIMITGDFNTIPLLDSSSIMRILTGKHLHDAINLSFSGHLGPYCSITNSKFFTPFTGPELTGFIPDHIFVNNKVDVLSHGIDTAKVNGEFPSDHFPVIIDIFLK
ncbi:MAG: endonuclease/exonuclease/phosphatase family protein [Parachlamydiales bacterium]|jgi:endonuclease/exonuclease/phosphatase family metal-dependent hydrolase